jgi:sugar phosphate permease
LKIGIPSGIRKPYYGWIVVAGLASVGAISVSMGGINFGLFLPEMSAELGIGQAYFGWAQTTRLLGFAASGFLIGRVLDRFGARIPLMIAGLLMGVVVVSLSFVTSGWQIIALFSIVGMIGMQGAGGNLYTSVPISRWFVRKRGKAMSAVFLGVPVGIFIFSPLSEYFISAFGWRNAWMILGIMGGTVIFIVAALIVRRSPQDMGLLPDGESVPPEDAKPDDTRPTPATEYSWTRAEALRTKTYWLLALIFGLRLFTQGTLGLFRIPYYIEQGISPSIVALSLSAEAIAAAGAAVPAGWAIDKVPARFVAVIPFIATGAAFLVTMNTYPPHGTYSPPPCSTASERPALASYKTPSGPNTSEAQTSEAYAAHPCP